MKKKSLICVSLLIITTFILLLSGCGSKSDKTTVAETYLDLAQDYLDEENYDSAVSILQKGLDATGDKKIAELLEEVLVLQIDAESAPLSDTSKEEASPATELEIVETFDPTPYLGVWATEAIGWQYGGMILDLTVDNNQLCMYLSYHQSAPASRVAEVYCSMMLNELYGNGIRIDVGDDGWGNTGVIELYLNDNYIECIVSNVKTKESHSPQWGLYDGVFYLYPNDTAYASMEYTQDMYDAMYGNNARPDSYEFEEQQPTYDTSKASGILASLGMTEEEFRTSCQPLCIISLSFEGQLEVDDLRENPNQYVGNHYFFSTDFNDETWGQPHSMRVDNKGTSLDGYIYYELMEDCVLYDYRDDTYAPTVSTGDGAAFYVIFTGVQTIYSTDYVCFNIISLDKIS